MKCFDNSKFIDIFIHEQTVKISKKVLYKGIHML